jgi:FixJ family two-component response regulator
VDDDQRIPKALYRLVSSAGITVITFLSRVRGFELRQQLTDGDALPIVFTTGHALSPPPSAP